MICRLRKGLLGILLLSVSISCFSQQATPELVDSVAATFLKELHSNPKEQIFVHTDKWFYVAGETIWFKAYCLGSYSHRLSRYSKTLMVDFVNDKDKVISHLLLNNQRLLTSGDIQLPINLPEGDYWLRAYTGRMLNKNVDQIYIKHVYVFNGGKKPVLDLPADDSPRVSFFPEGGSIIEATDQKIAVAIKDAAGNPLQVSGYITDEDDTARAKFNTSSTGVGSFQLYIQPGDYKVHIKSQHGNSFTYPLPSSNPGAASISILSATDSTMHVMVSLGDSLFKADAATVLLGLNKDKLCFAAGGHGLYELDIPKKNFPGGENRLLLFNYRHEVISERPFYVDRKNIVVTVQPAKDNFGDREKAAVDISFTDENNKPVVAWFSISIDDDNQVTQPLEKDESAFLPSDDNKHSLQYNADEKELALLAGETLYMGKKSNTPGPATIEDFQGIKGVIANQSGTPQNNKVVTLLGEGDEKMPVYGVDTTKQKGQFAFTLPNYTEGTQFQVDVTNLKGIQENPVVLVDSFHFPRFSTPENLKLKFYGAASRLPYFKTYNFDTSSFGKGRQWLNAVLVTGKKKAAIFPEDDKRLSRFSHLIYPDNFSAGVNNISNAIIMAPGVSLLYGHLSIGGRGGMNGNSDVLLVVDGSPIDFSNGNAPGMNPGGSSDALLQYVDRNLDKSTIQFIEILSGPEAAIYGLRGGNGVISVVTSAYSKSTHSNTESGLQKIQTNGYHKSVPFPSPDYNKEEELKRNPGMDQRATLYWNGDILTNEEGKATVSFFTSDQPSTYTATIQGVTLKGDIIYKRISIQRK